MRRLVVGRWQLVVSSWYMVDGVKELVVSRLQSYSSRTENLGVSCAQILVQPVGSLVQLFTGACRLVSAWVQTPDLRTFYTQSIRRVFLRFLRIYTTVKYEFYTVYTGLTITKTIYINQ